MINNKDADSQLSAEEFIKDNLIIEPTDLRFRCKVKTNNSLFAHDIVGKTFYELLDEFADLKNKVLLDEIEGLKKQLEIAKRCEQAEINVRNNISKRADEVVIKSNDQYYKLTKEIEIWKSNYEQLKVDTAKIQKDYAAEISVLKEGMKELPSDYDIEKLGEKWLEGKSHYATYDAHLTGFIKGFKKALLSTMPVTLPEDFGTFFIWANKKFKTDDKGSWRVVRDGCITFYSTNELYKDWKRGLLY